MNNNKYCVGELINFEVNFLIFLSAMNIFLFFDETIVKRRIVRGVENVGFKGRIQQNG